MNSWTAYLLHLSLPSTDVRVCNN